MLNVSSLRERMAFLMNPIISNELNLFRQELQYFLSIMSYKTSLNKLALYNDLVSIKQTNSLPLTYGSVRKLLAHHLHNCAVG